MNQKRAPLPVYPRLGHDVAVDLAGMLAKSTLEELEELSTTDTEAATYYQLAGSRVQSDVLGELRSEIRVIAAASGYPNPRRQGGAGIEFDRKLSKRILDLMPMLPADAADQGVWNFITLRLLPDVAAWRYPRKNSDGVEGGDNALGPYERYLGGQRNVFRRIWWRAYSLTPETSSKLIEDECVGLMERTAIGGYPPLASLIATIQLSYVDSVPGLNRQELLRDVLKRLRRRMGNISVYALTADDMDALVRQQFAESFARISRSTQVGSAPGLDNDEQSVAKPLADFERLCGDLWDYVRPMVETPSIEELSLIREEMERYSSEFIDDLGVVGELVDDLNRLLNSWSDLSQESQRIVQAAVTYFLAAEDKLPDYGPNGLDDDIRVIEAAFEALGIQRSD